LIIVPTKKMVAQVIENINYNKLGKAYPLTSNQGTVPREGIIVATPYVQTGLDIKPPPDILIDCGKDIIIDKGVFKYPFPWTDPDTDKQRIGRVGRLKAGVVFQPKSAGTGKRAVSYPAPHLFFEERVAEHFKVPALQPARNPIVKELPFLHVNTDKIRDLSVIRSLCLIHAISLAGVRQNEWKEIYNRKINKESLGEDYEFIERVYRNAKWKHYPLIPYNLALYHLNRQETVQYKIGGDYRWVKPLTVINGKWIELEESPTERLSFDELQDEVLSKSKFEMLKEDMHRTCKSISLLNQRLPNPSESVQRLLMT